MNHINQSTLYGLITSLANRSAVLRTKRVIVKGKQCIDRQPLAQPSIVPSASPSAGQAPQHSCKPADKPQKQPYDDIMVILPEGHRCKVGDYIWLYGHYASRRLDDGSLATYVEGEYITPVSRPSVGTTASPANSHSVRGYVARLAAPRTTRTGYSIQDALVATATPDGRPAYLPTVIFRPGKYPPLRLGGPVTLQGRLQARAYTRHDSSTGYAWELVPWWVSNADHIGADPARLASVSQWSKPPASDASPVPTPATIPCKPAADQADTTDNAQDTTQGIDYWLAYDAFDTSLDEEE